MGNLIFKDYIESVWISIYLSIYQLERYGECAFRSVVYNELSYTLSKPLHYEHFLWFLRRKYNKISIFTACIKCLTHMTWDFSTPVEQKHYFS